jgi:sugar/nucleoside kinase (ribokinase family)
VEKPGPSDLASPGGLEVLCIGNALVDVFSPVDAGVLKLWGLSEPAQHLEYGALREILVTLPDLVTASGGGAANVAKIAALLGLSAGFAGSVGPPGDHFARVFEGDLRAAGVLPALARGSLPTGLCLLLREPGGETVTAASPQAALEYDAGDVPEELIREARVVVVDGYMLGRDPLVERILDRANCYGTVAALDVGSAGQAAAQGEKIARYCRDYPLILFMNEREAEALYQALTGEENNLPPPRQGRYLRRIYAFFKTMTGHDLFPIIVIKRGKRGAAVFAGGSLYRADTLAINPTESTGAGDAFCAGFLAAWIRDKPLYECAALGNRVAREVLDVPGTRIDRKKLAALAKILKPV